MKHFITTILIVFTSINLYSNNWINISSPSQINEMVEKNGLTYLATNGGLLIVNHTTKKVDRIFKNDGIASNLVEDIDFDSEGNIWIGTYDNGVSMFNGTNWENFPIAEDLAFNSILLYSIALDANDKVWAATSAGILKLENNAWEIASSNICWDLTKNPNNNNIFYAGIFPGKIEEDTVVEFSDCPIFAYSNAKCEVIDNKLYHTAHGQMVSYENGVWDSLSISVPDEIVDMTTGSNGELLFYVKNNGIYTYSNGTLQAEHTSLNLENAQKGQLLYSNNKMFYAANNSLNTIANNTNTIIDLKYKNLTTNYFNTLIFSDEKILVKNQNSTLLTFNPADLNSEIYSPIANTTDYSDWRIAFSKENNQTFYLNVKTGQYFKNGSLSQAFDTAVLNFSNTYLVRDVLLDSENTLWLATQNLGLIEIKNNNITYHNTTNSPFTEDQIWSVTEDRFGNIWAGSSEEICKYDKTSWVEHHDAQANNWAFGGATQNIYFDENNILYCTSWANGLTKYDGNTWSVYQSQNSDLPDNNIKHIYASDGLMYLSTSGGFSIFDGTNFENYDKDNSGLMDNQCNQITKDQFGNIWISSSQGLNIFNKTGIVNAITNFKSESKLSIYPNPSSEILNISADKPINNIEIFNTLGKRVYYKQAINHNLATINISQFEKGLYYVVINGHSNKTSKVFIKN